MGKYAVGDIHGCKTTLKTLVEKGIDLRKKDELYLLGDYVDRGPDSKGVIDYIMDLQDSGYMVKCIKGNHEDMMINSEDREGEMARWLRNGGRDTLRSFGASTVSEIEYKYHGFLQSLEYFFEVDNYLLVHGGFNFKAPDPFRDYQSMMWIRYFEVDDSIAEGRTIIHGHTAMEVEEIKWQSKQKKLQVLCLDAGCVYKNRYGMGHLCAFNLESGELILQKNVDE